MKQGFKLLVVLLMTLLLTISATAQINWLKQDGNVKYLAWDNGSNSKTIYKGDTAAFTTGYFGSTVSQTVKLTVTINDKNDGKIVSTLVSKNVNVANTLGYELIAVLPEHYKSKAGEYIIVIKIKDANTEVVDSSLYLKVKPVLIINIPPLNHAPVMNNVDNKEVKENQNLQFTVSATDPDNDDLTFEARACLTLSGNCLLVPISIFGASFNEQTGHFSWTPSYNFVKHPSLSRVVDFRFRADDGDKKSTWEQVTVNVRDTNRKPQFDPIGNKVVQEKQLLKFTVHAVDLDHDGLTYSIQGGLPSGAVFNAGTHQFKWVPTNTQAGLYLVTFKVADGFGGQDTESIVIQVTDLPVEEPQCIDGLDNDGDGKVDFPADPGCTDQEDNDETDEPVEQPQCIDGIDNDRDGKIDFPSDPGCTDQEDDDETDEIDDPEDLPQCSDGIDNDNDALADLHDPGCSDENDDDESDEPVDQPGCIDGLDNDGDGKVDFPNDPGCTDQEDNDETDDSDNPEDLPQCSDGIDNDNDTLVDLHDPGCSDENDDDESNPDGTPTPKPKPASYTNIKFKTAHIEDMIVHAGELMVVHVHIFNNGKTDLKDVEVQATMYEIGAFDSTSDFNLPKGKGAMKSIYVPVPEEAQPGWYLVKITAKNYHYHTSTYRLAHIASNTFQ